MSLYSLTFLFRFLPFFLAVYYITPAKFRKFVLILGSLLFVGFTSRPAVPVVIGAVLAWSFARDAFWQSFLLFGAEVALGEAGVLFLLGMPLLSLIPRIFHLERKNAA